MSELKLLVTIDVEEEGLFSNQYKSSDISVENIKELSLLDPIFQRLAIHPTLFVSYQVAKHKPCHDFLMTLREKWHGEIGAHLHHWNTPPLQPLPQNQPVPSQHIPKEILQAKLQTLLQTLSIMGVDARSFRMGRFSLGPKMFSLLDQAGIAVDSSIMPTRREYGGPEYLSAPVDPYFPDPQDLSRHGNAATLEVPVTVLPIFTQLPALFERMADGLPGSRDAVSWFSKHIGSLPAQPMLVGLRRLKTAVRLHRYRGGTTVTLYFHSSELMPGGCPQHQTKGDVKLFVERIEKFLAWLRNDMEAVSMTLLDFRHYFSDHPGRE